MEQLRRRISAATQKEIRLVAVSKGQSAEAVAAVRILGQRDFGENYLQEALSKISKMEKPENTETTAGDICRHYIGRIQSNKTKPIAEHFDWAQTVTSLKIARRLNRQRPPEKGKLNVCVQVNISGEETKGGCAAEDAMSLCDQISEMEWLRLRGLMTIPRQTENTELLGKDYERMRRLFETIGEKMPADWDTLSMGMSADLEIAIRHRATMLRIGSALFGPRPKVATR